MTTGASTAGRPRSANGRFMAKDAAATAEGPVVARVPDAAANPDVAKVDAKDERKPEKSGGKKDESKPFKKVDSEKSDSKTADSKKAKKSHSKKLKRKSGGKKSKKHKKKSGGKKSKKSKKSKKPEK